MALFLGIAEGVEAGLQQREREETRKQEQDWRTKVHEYRVAQDEYTRSRQERIDQENREASDFDRKWKLIQAGIPISGSGGAVTPSTKTTKTSGDSPTEAAAATLVLSKRVEDAYPDLSDTDKEYFKTILNNPSAAHTLMSFIQEQESNKNKIDIRDVPALIEIAGMAEGKEVDAYKLLQDIGVDSDDPEAILEAARVIKSHVAPSVVLDIKADAYGTDYDALKEQESLVVGTLAMGVPALIKSGNLDPTVKTALIKAYNNKDSKDTMIADEAKNTILMFTATPEALQQLEGKGGVFRGVTKNEYLTRYFTLPTSPAPVPPPSDVSFSSLDEFKNNQSTANAIPPETWVSIGGTPYFVDKDGTLKQRNGG